MVSMISMSSLHLSPVHIWISTQATGSSNISRNKLYWINDSGTNWLNLIESDWVLWCIIVMIPHTLGEWVVSVFHGFSHVFPMGYRWSHLLPFVSPWSPASPAIDRCGRSSSPAPRRLAARPHVTDGKTTTPWKSPGNLMKSAGFVWMILDDVDSLHFFLDGFRSWKLVPTTASSACCWNWEAWGESHGPMAFCESTEGSAKMIENLEQSKIPKHKEIKEALRHLLTWDLVLTHSETEVMLGSRQRPRATWREMDHTKHQQVGTLAKLEQQWDVEWIG